MRTTATGLTLVAVGAILAFAVTGHPSFLNLHITGWVIMMTGLVGMAVPRRGYGWLRHRIVVKREPRGSATQIKGRYVLGAGGSPDGGYPPSGSASSGSASSGSASSGSASPGTPDPSAEETVEEEFFEE